LSSVSADSYWQVKNLFFLLLCQFIFGNQLDLHGFDAPIYTLISDGLTRFESIDNINTSIFSPISIKIPKKP
jgi:hypothetical protein